MVQVGHRHHVAPGEGFEVGQHGSLVGVVGRANANAELLDRFPRANAGAISELTAPVDLGLNLGGDRVPVGRVKRPIHRHGLAPHLRLGFCTRLLVITVREDLCLMS